IVLQLTVCLLKCLTMQVICNLFFFFQAEDGIRDLIVTGVQTCALPISPGSPAGTLGTPTGTVGNISPNAADFVVKENGKSAKSRSEERRVGKECRSWWLA